MTAPVWILLKRSGDLISVYYATDLSGNRWILIGRDTLPGLAATVNVGLAVSSHADGTLATARFRDLVLLNGPGWVLTASDIGAVGVPGNGNFSQTTGDMLGSGADIWGTAMRSTSSVSGGPRTPSDGARPVAPADASVGENGIDVPRDPEPRLAARDADRLGRQWRGDAVTAPSPAVSRAMWRSRLAPRRNGYVSGAAATPLPATHRKMARRGEPSVRSRCLSIWTPISASPLPATTTPHRRGALRQPHHGTLASRDSARDA